MQRLTWNEIKARAAKFAREWKDSRYEKGETQTFYNEFFEVFGMSRRRVASFEHPVKKLGDKRGFIDLFWKGLLLVEQKSAGRSLEPAKTQALDYFPGLEDHELPRFILLSDFQTFELHDLESDEPPVAFPLHLLPQHVRKFGFITGAVERKYEDQAPVNIRASELMGELHDGLKASGYEGEDLEMLLVRLVFCLFADDTGIFERDLFDSYIDNRTSVDGSDLGRTLNHLFQVLNTPKEKRSRNLDEDLAAFEYINGDLFSKTLSVADFDSNLRKKLLKACRFDWSQISPAIFGALFQSVMDKKKRRGIGAHYTSEKNILKVVSALFLDELRSELTRAGQDRSKLLRLHAKVARLRFLDPACGSGNFLIIAYRELRRLETELLRNLNPAGAVQQELDVHKLSLIDVDAFYGIELEEFPAKIAEVALWLTDHLANIELSEAFGQSYVRIPLKKSAHIYIGNALRLDWESVVPADTLTHILGNPPFIGHQYRSDDQKKDMVIVWGAAAPGKRFGRLDYVTAWYKKALEVLTLNPSISVSFVSTNSICQGEQATILWPELFGKGVVINFAHRTFQWASDAKGKAAVHCVIIGFALATSKEKRLFDYENVKGDPLETRVGVINAYLIEASQLVLPSRTSTPAGLPQMIKGSQPTDGGHLILEEFEKRELVELEPGAENWLRPYVGGEEFLKGTARWCLWLKGISPDELRNLPLVLSRTKRVRAARLRSKTLSVQQFADKPTFFTQDRQPVSPYLALPEVSSENRRFIPVGLMPPSVVASNKLQIIVGGTSFHLGVLSSTMHMAWVRTVAGRLKSDYSYSPSVYNNFPWPQCSDKAREAIEVAADQLLDVRSSFGASLATLYDPDLMPPELVAAHQALDRAVDRAYRIQPFSNDRNRVEFLFQLYADRDKPLLKEARKTFRAKV